jgi:hypothetical protein
MTYVNYQTVIANAFTCGLIPGLNGRADTLMQQDAFYRVVDVTAVVSREAAIMAATGGMGNAQTATRWGARLVCTVTTLQRATAPFMLYRQLDTITDSIDGARRAMAAGDAMGAARGLMQTALQMPGMIASARAATALARAATGLGPQTLRDFLTNCFAAGTPILGEHGSKPIEDYRVGEQVWARDENDPNAPAALRPIEECFVSECEVWHLHVKGEPSGGSRRVSRQVIGTTGEQPFWVVGDPASGRRAGASRNAVRHCTREPAPSRLPAPRRGRAAWPRCKTP